MNYTEVKAVLSFQDLKRGDRIQVDINDPAVAALIRAGYLKIIWSDHATVAHPGGVGPDAASDLDPRAEGPEEEALDGTDPDQPVEESHHRT